jgi:hypothetical protein
MCWCFAFSVQADAAVCQQHYCLAVIDAGSTGSRLHVYAYDLDARDNPIQIDEYWSKKITPGFANLELNQTTIDNYLDNLFEGNLTQTIPVYFYATGGMRLLPQSKQQRYYQFLQHWFAEQKQWQLVDAKTISGSEEGVFGWLAVNYRVGALSDLEKPLVNVMDMGGASVQITFPLQDDSQVDTKDVFDVNVYGRHLKLFAHSFLGLGQTSMLNQFLDKDSCFANGYPLPGGGQGKGDGYKCQDEMSQLINNVHGVDRVVKSAITQSYNSSWYAMGGVVWLSENKPSFLEDKQFTIKNLFDQADTQVCHQNWVDLLKQYPNNDYLCNSCLYTSYYYALIVNGYGIQPEEPIHYSPPTQGYDWSLGVLLHRKVYKEN